ncbi:hypothetical protein CkaCkLH20_08562 [Colletotrichum karsti]|uniref:Chromo domain-containing protein n=1 Tax=Colletotrichum karsti TaxID=1095194 RepID=A0A9P6HZN4_9PEZI|nr:uncharacterized protein CkaCkLH20_08562 [Colletotrichum karsti]KAF9873828.1 hypothetical protein CkaCkLH20_08562 [Colletotrichum karsti]
MQSRQTRDDTNPNRDPSDDERTNPLYYDRSRDRPVAQKDPIEQSWLAPLPRVTMSRRIVWFGRPSAAAAAAAPNTTSSTRKPTSKSKSPEHVQLAVVFKDIATYRPYKPGAGPRLRPVTLLPVHDSTAYIRDEFFVPHTLSEDGKKRLQYVVGWTDLPAARLVVDAERIADYVSPLAYEEWCAARAAERDEEERRKEEEENVRAVAEAEARERGIGLRNGAVKETSPVTEDTTARTGGKRKRRTKAEMEAARAATPAEEGEKRRPGRPRKHAPSLSTPSKARLEEFGGLETEAEPETENPDDEEAIFRQLNGDLSVAEDEYDSGEASSVRTGLEPPTKKQRTISPGAPLSRLLPGIETDSSRSTPFDSSRGATSSPALPPLPNPARSVPLSAFPSVPQASANYTSTPPATVKKVTPIMPPMPPKRSLLSLRDPPPSSAASHPPSSKSQTPASKPWQRPPNMKETAIKPPINGTAVKSKPRTESAPAAIPTPQTNTTPAKTPTPRTGFTPLAQSSRPWSASQAVKNATTLTPTQPLKSVQHAPPSSATPKSRSARQQKRSAAQDLDPDRDELAENRYEVLRLEGLQVRQVHNKPIRFFAVRWKGRWPPGQNPTWEPEENIPLDMVRKYLLANPTAARKGTTGTLDKYLTPNWSQRKFSSVSEAFEGGVPDAAAGEAGDDVAVEEEDEGEGGEDEKGEENGVGDEMLLVTDEPPPTVRPTLSW